MILAGVILRDGDGLPNKDKLTGGCMDPQQQQLFPVLQHLELNNPPAGLPKKSWFSLLEN